MAWNDTVRTQLMAYCCIDVLEERDEDLLREFYDAAVSYMEEAGISEPKEGTRRRAKYDLCVNAMVLDSWDHRDMNEPVNQVTENAAFRRRLNQLKFSDPVVSDSDT